MHDGLLARLEREAGVRDLLSKLVDRLAPTDMQSLLLELEARMAAKVTPKRLQEQYDANRFVRPAAHDPRALLETERIVWSQLPAGYAPLELAPLCPLGTHSAVTGISQHRIVTTVRNTEVVSDSTNVLALECAKRRRQLLRSNVRGRVHRDDPVLLAACHRLTRAQHYPNPTWSSHFRIFGLCAAGRDPRGEGGDRASTFEQDRLVEQIACFVRVIHGVSALGVAFSGVRIAVTNFGDASRAPRLEDRVLHPLARLFPDATCLFDATREQGRGYYGDMCYKIHAVARDGTLLELADGGPTDWTRRLLSDRKERLVIGGLSIDRLCPVA